MRVRGGVSCLGDCFDIVIDNIDGGTVQLFAWAANAFPNVPTRWVIKNSDWGPCASSGPGTCEAGTPQSGQVRIIDSVDIKFINNNIHNFDTATTQAPHDHFECVIGERIRGIVFRSNRFWGCEIYAINIGGGSFQGTENYIENNWFGGGDWANAGPNGKSVTVAPLQPGAHVYVRFNSFSSQDGITADGPFTGAGWHFIGNIIGDAPGDGPGQNCFTQAEFKYNVYIGPGKCGDSTNIAGAGNMYVNGVRGASMNYHLAAGTWLADNYVPGSLPNSDLAMDFDGQARSAPRDAGSDGR